MTIDPKQPFPFDQLGRLTQRGVDHARRIKRAERGGYLALDASQRVELVVRRYRGGFISDYTI